MEAFQHVIINGLFVLAVILIWFMIAWQLLLTLAGYFHQSASHREKRIVDEKEYTFPGVSILIPAHNEAVVIARTLEAMCGLDYPADKLEIIVINDGSSDETGSIVRAAAARDPRVICFDVPEGEGGQGKSRALNLGIRQASHEYIAVYDADNTPAATSESARALRIAFWSMRGRGERGAPGFRRSISRAMRSR